MSHERPDALLKSALEKIVYFEARASQLSNDLAQAQAERDRVKSELGQASQREIELRRVIAELEVRTQRAHSEREEAATVAEALRRERAELLGKILDASRLNGETSDFDLASFIAELRSEVILRRETAERATPVLVAMAASSGEARLQHAQAGTGPLDAAASAFATPSGAPQGQGWRSAPTEVASSSPTPHGASEAQGWRSAPTEVASSSSPTPHGASEAQGWRSAPTNAAPPSLTTPSAAPEAQGRLSASKDAAGAPSYITTQARRLEAQGRLTVSPAELAALERASPFAGRTEETLFGFSVRELSAPDASARVRAAERLTALGHPAAAPALATALHAETEGRVKVALLEALSHLAKAEAVPVVVPQLSAPAPEVRMTALKALLKLDATQAGPHLAAAVKDPDSAVRRRASLLALSLTGQVALELGETAIRDAHPDVRSLAALVLGASGLESARPWLMTAMRDPEVRVRRSASQALSRLLGQDVSQLVDLDEAQRRREVRRLAQVPSNPVKAKLVAALPARPGSAALSAAGAARAGSNGLAGGPAQRTATLTAQSGGGPSQHPTPSSHEVQPTVAHDERSLPPTRASHDLSVRPPVAHDQRSLQSTRGSRDALLPVAPLEGGDFGLEAREVRSEADQLERRGPSLARAGDERDAPSHLVSVETSHRAPVANGSSTSGAQVAGLAATARVAVLEAPAPVEASLLDGVLTELRAAIRGQSADALAASLHTSLEAVRAACGELMSQGQVVRRGLKYFVA